jgi:hypothetical protein
VCYHTVDSTCSQNVDVGVPLPWGRKLQVGRDVAVGRCGDVRAWTVGRARRFTALLLVRGVTPTAAPITTTIATARREASATETAPTPEATAAAATAHTGDVGALGRHLDIAALEDTLV